MSQLGRLSPSPPDSVGALLIGELRSFFFDVVQAPALVEGDLVKIWNVVRSKGAICADLGGTLPANAGCDVPTR